MALWLRQRIEEATKAAQEIQAEGAQTEGEEVNFITFLLLVLTFPYWFPVVAIPALVIGALWMIGYPVACTVHMLYVRARYGKWVRWQLLYPDQ